MKQYSFNSVSLLINAVPVTGFAQSNNIISAARSADQHTDVISARGGMSVATVPDKSGVVSFTLLQTSASNTILWGIAKRAQGSTWSIFENFIPMSAVISERSMTLGSGLALVTARGGYFPRQPVVNRGMGIATVTWTIRFERLTFLYGTYLELNPIDDIIA